MQNLFMNDTALKLVPSQMPVSEDEVRLAQQNWAKAIIDIGQVYVEGGDYYRRAESHLLKLYNFEDGPVLFKPDFAAEEPIRLNLTDVISYFVGGDIAEDNGFALQSWSRVDFGRQQIVVMDGGAFAMGEYFLTPQNTTDGDLRVEFTFGYIKRSAGDLQIWVHHASLPFEPVPIPPSRLL